jgi:SAM-dependent methyltransferase
MPELSAVSDRMRRDWNERAREDANFYVAFGRREQTTEEFFATGADVVRSLRAELRRLPACDDIGLRSALEIGCGPGRLMKPMSEYFAEIHGVDVSDEMIARARQNLSGVARAHVHHTTGADLARFKDESFDFVYSYAVFQHIPSREVVFSYLREACRVIRPGGIIRVQINGLDPTAKEYDTWSGVRVTTHEVRRFALDQRMQLLALEGARTQYMWVTLRRPETKSVTNAGRPLIRRVTNAESSEPVVPARGRFAAISVWLEDLPPDSDLNSLQLLTETTPAVITYIGPAEWDGLRQVNAILGSMSRTGLLPVVMLHRGMQLCPASSVRVIPAPPPIPAVISVADGVDLLSGLRIVSGTVKVIVEEVADPEEFMATVGGRAVTDIDIFCSDPLPPRHEINFNLPAELAPGPHLLEMRCRRRWLGAAELFADVQERPEG